ncbi:MAG: nitroreductase family protein [Deltaproteobacteria bacterium]|nr:nitroreductase family protein [Deltaproteobacteria bacterium]
MFLSLIEKRRSIRRFQGRRVEPEKVDMLIEAALRSPSSLGNNPWEFVVVDDADLLEKLSRAKQHGSSFLKNAPLGIVVCADPGKSSVWVEDASIASIFILLAAESIGLGGCWIQIRERIYDGSKTSEAYISELLGIPEGIKVEAIMAVGYPAETKAPHPREDLLFQRVYLGSHGKPRR